MSLNRSDNPEAYGHHLLQCAIMIGSNMLMTGAEIHRVEDTVKRICLAYGAEEAEVFSITYTIIVTVSSKDFGILTQTKRISGFAYNLNIMNALNALSRKICEEHPSFESVEADVQNILTLETYSSGWIIFAYALISAAFTVFFGGALQDALVSGCIGVAMRLVELPLRKLQINRFVVVCLCSATAGFLAITATNLGLGLSAEKISIGNIMVLVPGLLLTNSIRDLFADNMISGFVRICEVVLLSIVIAFGFAIAHASF